MLYLKGTRIMMFQLSGFYYKATWCGQLTSSAQVHRDLLFVNCVIFQKASSCKLGLSDLHSATPRPAWSTRPVQASCSNHCSEECGGG